MALWKIQFLLSEKYRVRVPVAGIVPYYTAILLLWLFQEPIVTLSIKAHRPILPVAALYIGTLVPILLLRYCKRVIKMEMLAAILINKGRVCCRFIVVI